MCLFTPLSYQGNPLKHCLSLSDRNDFVFGFNLPFVPRTKPSDDKFRCCIRHREESPDSFSLNHHKFVLINATPRADPGVGQVIKRGVRSDILGLIPDRREINIPTFRALVLFHDPEIAGREYMCLEEWKRRIEQELSERRR